MQTTSLTSSSRRSISASVRSNSRERVLLVVAGVDQHDSVAGLQRPRVHVGNAGPRKRQPQSPDAREHAVGTSQPVPAVRVAHAREPTGSPYCARGGRHRARAGRRHVGARLQCRADDALRHEHVAGRRPGVGDRSRPGGAGARRASLASGGGAGRDRGHRPDPQPPRSLAVRAGAARALGSAGRRADCARSRRVRGAVAARPRAGRRAGGR